MTQRFSETFNWSLFGVVAALLLIGLVNLYSAVHYWEEGGAVSLFWNQLIWIIIGLGLMILTAFFDYRILKRLALPIFFFILFLLVAAVLFSSEVRGHKGWLQLGWFRMQPAEYAKLAYIVIAAKFFSDHPNPDGSTFADLWRPAVFMLLPCLMIIQQGDLGSSLFLVCIFVSLAWFGKIQRKTLIASLIIGAAIVGGVYSFGLKEYQRNRIAAFLNPEADVKGSGYHLMQSKIAVGSGKLFGKGYLKGNINKLRYLPERHTDFIFPVLAEEWGFLGSLVVLSLYASFLLIGIEIARKARDRFGSFLAVGVMAMIFWQLVINLGGVLGLIPLTGVTLPLLSYGGSSMVATLLGIGMLMSISIRRFMF